MWHIGRRCSLSERLFGGGDVILQLGSVWVWAFFFIKL